MNSLIPLSKDKLRREREESHVIDIKTFGTFNLFSNLMQEEMVRLKDVFGNAEIGHH